MKVYRAFALHGDVPIGRTYAWNVAFIGLIAGGIWWAHSTGDSWLRIAAAIVLAVGIGGAVLAYVITVGTPRALRRHEELLRSHLAVRHLPAGAPISAASTERTRHVA